PPADAGELEPATKEQLVDWLSREIQVASFVRRGERPLGTFRRLTNYEYNHALQDLLGLPNQFAANLPPENAAPDGFQNSAETLAMSETQLRSYLGIGREAIQAATAFEPQPETLYWQLTMAEAASEMQLQLNQELEKKRRKFADDPERLQREVEKLRSSKASRSRTFYENTETGDVFQAKWRYSGAKYAWTPEMELHEVPEVGSHVAVLPPQQKLVIELGNQVPDAGVLKIRVRAARVQSPSKLKSKSAAESPVPSLRIEYGFQASNNSSASETVSTQDLPIRALPGDAQFYEWQIPLANIAMRNPMRHSATMGKTPSPSEYIKIHNSVVPPEPGTAIDEVSVQLDYVEVTTPVNEKWPPASHRHLFGSEDKADFEEEYVERTLKAFMVKAWRGVVEEDDVARKMRLYRSLVAQSSSPQQAAAEVLATVLASPRFLYVTRSNLDQIEQGNAEQTDPTPAPGGTERLTDIELASRLSLFLWCSGPDELLMRDAESGQLSEATVLARHVERMLEDTKSHRFSKHFVQQWLGLESLEYLQVDRKIFPHFDPSLAEAIRSEPVKFFHDVLQNNASVFDFLHSNYVVVNERLARHYHIAGVYGNDFRRVDLSSKHRRGGLLTQAAMLAMNSDGVHSHPLKRGIWLLERILNDPPPPPPPSVPEIDVADPRIAEMTLKERLEDHRDDPACYSCHAKIDPWGIAFENFDAVGAWRNRIDGDPVDASSQLFNKAELDGVEGLKAYLLRERQDQFVRGLVSKLSSFAVGRPLAFEDQAEIERIAIELRTRNDGLRSLVQLIVSSELFLNR
ncbi:MAG: DUF1592 domain-containing protein, partial [Planctomycetota bacterium]